MDDSMIKRSQFLQEVAEAMIETNAINIEGIASVVGKYGRRAVLEGESLVNIVHKNIIINCGWPLPEIERFRSVQGIGK